MSNSVDAVDRSGGKRVLVAVGSPQDSRWLQDVLTLAGLEVGIACSLEELPHKIQETNPHLLVLDSFDPRTYDFCANIRADEAVKLYLATQRSARHMLVMLANPGNADDLARGLEAGCDDFITTSMSPQAVANAVQSLLTERPRRCNMSNAEHLLTLLSRAGEGMESPGGGHLEQVAAYALLMARHLDLSFEERLLLRKAALFHDIGKIGVETSILLKKGPLTAGERERMMLHPDIGERICRPLHQEKPVLDAIRHHHERYDGAGYPDGLRGQDIPLFARIVTVADAYDAMISARPYRDKLSTEDALTELRDKAGKQFDPALADTFCTIIDQFRVVEPSLTAAAVQ